MRELVRADLPELLVIGERARTVIGRSSVAFALLAGIGAALIFGDVLRSVSFAILEIARPERAPRPYDFQQILGPAAGLVVARRAGGIAGGLAYLGYSGIVVAIGWVGRVLTCADLMSRGQFGLHSFCAFGPLDLLAGAAPLLVGLGIGAVAARTIGGAPRPGRNPLLEAAGAHVTPSVVSSVVFAFGARAFAYQGSGVFPQQVAFIVAITLMSAVLAGTVAGLRSTTPVRTASVLAAVLIATWLYPLGASQLQMAAGADRPEVYLSAVPLLGLAVIPLAAYVASKAVIGWRPRGLA